MFDGVSAGLKRSEAKIAERCPFATRTAVRSCKLIDQNDRKIFRICFDNLSGGEKCLISIAMGSVICSF